MRAEAVIMTLLNASAQVTALVGNRIYLARMVENDPYPAIVVEAVSGVLVPPINAKAGMQLMQARIQVTALSRKIADVKNLLDYARIALEFQSGVIAANLNDAIVNVTVQAIVRDSIGPDFKNDDMSVYLQSHDYMVMHFET